MMRRAISTGVLAQTLGTRRYTDARTIRKPFQYDQLVNSTNREFMENMIRQYDEDAALVDPSWAPVLQAIRSGNDEAPVVSTFSRPFNEKSLTDKQRQDNMRLSYLVREYERRGHGLANIEPIKGLRATNTALAAEELAMEAFGFTEADLQLVFNVSLGANYRATTISGGTPMTLEEIIKTLKRMYCGPIGFEFMSSGFFELRNWFRQQIMETLDPLPKEVKLAAYSDTVRACGFEQFLQIKYATQQRFGLDGGEALIAAMNAAMLQATELGVQSCIMGMAHRGRLNILANVCHKSLHAILNEFEGKAAITEAHLSGDVKYHLGLRKKVKLANGKSMDLELLPNPSHLEAVNPLVLGKARARQVYEKDVDSVATMPILIHGDAAMTGQGCCFETMALASLENYSVGGTLHVVINNQIGFTTDPKDSRPGDYCTELSKINNAPVMHVNGDDVEACVRAARIATRFRQEFHRDVILDVVCYRRNGHNEADLPDFTQPTLYKEVRKHPRVVDIYSKQLMDEGLLTAESVKEKNEAWQSVMRQAFERMNSVQDFVKVLPVFDPESENRSSDLQAEMIEQSKNIQRLPFETGVPMATLKEVGRKLTTIPAEVEKAHPVVQRTYAARQKGVETGDAIEWCSAELIALGTLSLQGVHVRLTGEDVERGTFTQRHAAIVDQKTNLKYLPVTALSPSQALVTIQNSALSELGVCGFEMGYNLENLRTITMWEAQFGDFANGAQVIFDQFLSCSEQKWNEQSSLILSLPHGYSGAGPEHSSARIERFLQMSDDIDRVPKNFRQFANDRMLEERIGRYNWQVTYPSTPANYFHLLRRQGLRSDFAKPLVNFFSKARLRAPNLSSLSQMESGSAFLPVIDTCPVEDVTARKVVFCTGQIESIVNDHRAALQKETPGAHNDVVIVTVEQLSPFPWEHVADVLEKYTARNPQVEIVWLQEEPKNMGSWTFMRTRFNALLRHLGVQQKVINFIGRPSVASPSTGYGSVHVEEERKIVNEVLA